MALSRLSPKPMFLKIFFQDPKKLKHNGPALPEVRAVQVCGV
jgi:hypothetical protein